MALPPRNPGARLSGAILHRAAAALITFCEYHRPRLRAYIDNLEMIATTTTMGGSRNTGGGKVVQTSGPHAVEDDCDDASYSSGGGSDGKGEHITPRVYQMITEYSLGIIYLHLLYYYF